MSRIKQFLEYDHFIEHALNTLTISLPSPILLDYLERKIDRTEAEEEQYQSLLKCTPKMRILCKAG